MSRVSVADESSNSKTEEQVLVSNITDYSMVPSLYAKKLTSYKSYKSVTSGSTKATVLFINTEQSIDVTVLKGDYSYMKNESHSSMVNTVHTAYFNNNNVVYKNLNEEYTRKALNDYLDIYGVYPFDSSIEGYIISGSGVTSVEKLESESNYKFKLTMNPETSTTNVRIQMREFGGLDDYPKFESIEIVITIMNDFTPISLELKSKYKAKMFMDASCEQSYTVTYSNFNEDITIPDLDTVKPLFQ